MRTLVQYYSSNVESTSANEASGARAPPYVWRVPCLQQPFEDENAVADL